MLCIVAVTLGLTGTGCDGAEERDGGAPDAGARDGGVVDASAVDAGPLDASAPGGPGHVTYHLDGHAYRIAAQAGAVPEDLSASLDSFEVVAGEDGAATLSSDGAWLALLSERFDAECDGWACLFRVSSDLSSVELVGAAGAAVHPDGFFVIAPGGDLVVYAGTDGPHPRDLFVVRRVAGSWSAPVLLTGSSSQQIHDFPDLRGDGATVVFDCGPDTGDDRGLCEVGIDGTGFREVLMPSHLPPGESDPALQLHHPHYAADGAIVFEGEWGTERIWRLDPGAAEPTLLTDAFGNDNSPCILPNGDIASLWLGRPENPPGYHELKVMSADGTAYEMLVTGVDVDDWGLGCGP